MLDQALTLITQRLKQYLHLQFDLDENIVELASPVAPDGVMPIEANDKLLVFLANVTKDTLPANNGHSPALGDRLNRAAPLHLNLYIFIAANFRAQRYQEGLGFLSQAIRCFQETPVIDRSVEVDIDPSIDKLVLDIENTDLNQASNLWSIMGGKYLPSVYYKVRMLSIVSSSISSRVIPTSSPRPNVGR